MKIKIIDTCRRVADNVNNLFCAEQAICLWLTTVRNAVRQAVEAGSAANQILHAG